MLLESVWAPKLMEIWHLNTSPLRKMVNQKDVLSVKNKKHCIYMDRCSYVECRYFFFVETENMVTVENFVFISDSLREIIHWKISPIFIIINLQFVLASLYRFPRIPCYCILHKLNTINSSHMPRAYVLGYLVVYNTDIFI